MTTPRERRWTLGDDARGGLITFLIEAAIVVLGGAAAVLIALVVLALF